MKMAVHNAEQILQSLALENHRQNLAMTDLDTIVSDFKYREEALSNLDQRLYDRGSAILYSLEEALVGSKDRLFTEVGHLRVQS